MPRFVGNFARVLLLFLIVPRFRLGLQLRFRKTARTVFLGLLCGGGGRSVSPKDAVQFFAPPLFLEVEFFLEVVHYSFICSFGMTVAFWVSRARGLNLDFPLYTKIVEYF